jgi:hypothetical protein
MFGKKNQLSPLESRKQMLIAESEINRTQMIQEWRAAVNDVHALAAQARTITSYASAGAVLVATLASLRRSPASSAGVKSSWLQTVVKAAKVAGSLWLAFRARPKS